MIRMSPNDNYNYIYTSGITEHVGVILLHVRAKNPSALRCIYRGKWNGDLDMIRVLQHSIAR